MQKEHEYPANKRHHTPGKKRDERYDDVSGTGVVLHQRNYVNPRTYVATKMGIIVKLISYTGIRMFGSSCHHLQLCVISEVKN